MQRRRLFTLLITLKLIFLGGISYYFIDYRLHLPRILIVHSYNSDYGWVQRFNEGLNRVLKDKSNFTIHWQYMNTREHPTYSYKQKAGIIIRQLIGRLQPSILVAVDADAQDFVAKFYVDDPQLSIIFCGINGDPKNYAYDGATNVTGIRERLPLGAVKNALPYIAPPTLNPSALNIIALGDMSRATKTDERFILDYEWTPYNLIDVMNVGNFDDWKKAVLDSNTRAHCLYVLNYAQVEDKPGSGHFVKAADIIQWTEQHATIPVVGSKGFVVEDGGSFAIAPSSYEQGEVAAQSVLRLLAGESPSAIPINFTQQFLVFMRERQDHRFERLPSIYPAFARSIGKYFK